MVGGEAWGGEAWRGIGGDGGAAHCALNVIYCRSRLIVLPSSSCALQHSAD